MDALPWSLSDLSGVGVGCPGDSLTTANSTMPSRTLPNTTCLPSVSSLDCRDEELGAVGVFACVGHCSGRPIVFG